MSTKANSEPAINAMREGGQILARIFDDVRGFVKPGVSGSDIDAYVAEKIKHYGASPTYREPIPNFPGVICVSVNDAVVHGVPNQTPFRPGDIVGFDLVITFKGMKVDSAFSMVIGQNASGEKKRLLEFTERSLYAGIDAIKGEGTMTGDIGAAIEGVLSGAGLGIVRDLVGHGIGTQMHMPPDVPNFGSKGTGSVLHEGDTIAIEPMAMLGAESVFTDPRDHWTIRTKDGSLAAHFEHTVLVTKEGAEILTIK